MGCVCRYALVCIPVAPWGPGKVTCYFPEERRDENALAKVASQGAGR